MVKNKTIRDTDEHALQLSHDLIFNATHGVIAANDSQSNFPHVSRIQLSTDTKGNVITLISTLATHTKCLIENPQCALLIGDPGKGDPLAHPRISLQVIAEPVPRNSSEHTIIRASHLKHCPKAELYVDFGDFSFFKLMPQSASLNGGFGKAYQLTKDEVTSAIKMKA